VFWFCSADDSTEDYNLFGNFVSWIIGILSVVFELLLTIIGPDSLCPFFRQMRVIPK